MFSLRSHHRLPCSCVAHPVRLTDRIWRYQVNEDILSPEQRTLLPIQDGCKPLFVIFKVWRSGLWLVSRASFLGCCRVVQR